MSMVPPWPARKVEDVLPAPALVEALGDPEAIERKYPCICDDCFSRGLVLRTRYEGQETIVYGPDGEAF